ncbi:centromere protein O isoform X2 [Esox lucius]|nr:centromere protein O isoform X2 [Esox lucius]
MLEMKANHLAVKQQEVWQVKVGREEQLNATLQALIIKRDQLKAELKANTSLQNLRTLLDKTNAPCERDVEDMENGSENSQTLLLMARHTQLKDLLHAHHLIGGYNVLLTKGKGVCVSIATAYEGLYLETYNLEINLQCKIRISRHNIPPFIPLETMVKQGNMQTDIRAFLDTLSQYLNAYVGRRQQLHLVKEIHNSVQVMESNALCTILVLMFTVPGEKARAALCTLEYNDHTQCLPTRVLIESEDTALASSPQWKKDQALLLETPVHRALVTLKKKGSIA